MTNSFAFWVDLYYVKFAGSAQPQYGWGNQRKAGIKDDSKKPHANRMPDCQTDFNI